MQQQQQQQNRLSMHKKITSVMLAVRNDLLPSSIKLQAISFLSVVPLFLADAKLSLLFAMTVCSLSTLFAFLLFSTGVSRLRHQR